MQSLVKAAAYSTLAHRDYELNANVAFNKDQVLMFLNGLVLGSLEENHLKEMEGCFTDAEFVAGHMTEAVKDFAAKDLPHIMSGLTEIGDIFLQMPKIFGDCTSGTIKVEAARLAKWAEPFKNPKEESAKIMANVLANYVAMIHDLDVMNQILAKADIVGGGKEAAQILELALGPVPSADPETVPYTQW